MRTLSLNIFKVRNKYTSMPNNGAEQIDVFVVITTFLA